MRSLDELERCRSILEIAITQNLDMPEMVWKTYINIELANFEIEKVRVLYSRLLNKTKHEKVWISYAKFEQENLKARAVMENAYLYFKQSFFVNFTSFQHSTLINMLNTDSF